MKKLRKNAIKKMNKDNFNIAKLNHGRRKYQNSNMKEAKTYVKVNK
jgi:hypothetical protein